MSLTFENKDEPTGSATQDTQTPVASPALHCLHTARVRRAPDPRPTYESRQEAGASLVPGPLHR